ncbi:hypothetical protein [Flavobacterium psychrotrophum]|uniref:hypothetical protein n=1 Tax=Flavobacterium psychrotrophum TaxID=2294119 RepID=UPI000E31C908|nr:hypothetical protein [Flavobacterium psychrotrophum]
MDAIIIPSEKEFEALINDLRVLMDVTAITLHESNTAGKMGDILTIVMEGNFTEIASEMYDRSEKLFEKYSVQLPCKIVDSADVIHKLKDGNLYYLKWYLTCRTLFKNDTAYSKMIEKLPAAQSVFLKAMKHVLQMFGKADAMSRGAQHYMGTNSHQLALLTIHQNIISLFGIVGELTSGKAYSGKSVNDQQGITEEFAPAFSKLFDRSNPEEAELVELLHTVTRSFPYTGNIKIKKETVVTAYKKMQWMLKETRKVYKEQLSSCEAALSTFQEPVREKPLKLSDTNDENTALDKISRIIIKAIKTKAIYCFGKNEALPPRDSLAVEEKKATINFYLLVFEDGLTPNTAHDLAGKIRSKSKGRYTVTLLIHNVAELETEQADQKYFFHKVISSGQQVYLTEHQPIFNSVTPQQRNIAPAIEYLHYRNTIANILLEHVADGYDSSYTHLTGMLLHHVVEQACLAMIRLFLGYSPNYFSIGYLLEICEHFSPEIANFFPTRTESDLRILKQLSRQPWTLRYSGKDMVSTDEMELLEGRCNEFVAHVHTLVNKALEDMQGMDKSEDQD